MRRNLVLVGRLSVVAQRNNPQNAGKLPLSTARQLSDGSGKQHLSQLASKCFLCEMSFGHDGTPGTGVRETSPASPLHLSSRRLDYARSTHDVLACSSPHLANLPSTCPCHLARRFRTCHPAVEAVEGVVNGPLRYLVAIRGNTGRSASWIWASCSAAFQSCSNTLSLTRSKPWAKID
jgi:hypothetical protein